MSRWLLLLSILSVALPGTASAAPRCFADPGDVAGLEAGRAGVHGACHCFGVSRQGDYRRCVAAAIRQEVLLGTIRQDCAATLRKIMGSTVCARTLSRRGPAVPCVSTSASGRVRCTIKPWETCEAPGARTCEAGLTCVAAADVNGDQQVAAPGDDGTCTAGGALIDNGDGTITDTGTRIVWEKLSDDDSIHDKDRVMNELATFGHASQLNGMAFGGSTTWRVPTIAELQTLIRRSPLSPGGSTIAPEFDSGCAPGCSVLTCSCNAPAPTWSESGSRFEAGVNWVVDFQTGEVELRSRSELLRIRAAYTLP